MTLMTSMAQNEVQLELLRQRLVRECDDFNTVDAYRLLDKNAVCEVSPDELAQILVHDIRIDTNACDVQSIDLIVETSLKYSQFCDIFVPKSQKVLAELTAKKPKNL